MPQAIVRQRWCRGNADPRGSDQLLPFMITLLCPQWHTVFFVFISSLWHTRLQQKGVDLPSRTSASMCYRHGPRTTNKGPMHNHCSPCQGRIFAQASHFDLESLHGIEICPLLPTPLVSPSLRVSSSPPACTRPRPFAAKRVIVFPHPVGSIWKHLLRPSTPKLKLHRRSHSIPLRFLRMYFQRMTGALCPIGARLRSPG